MTMMYPLLQHDLGHHLSDPHFTSGGQAVYVGTRPVNDGWVIAVIRIDGCLNENEASWLGTRIRDDLLTHMRFANQDYVPQEAVDVECGVPAGADIWSIAVYVTLGSMAEAEAMKTFLTNYVQPASTWGVQ